MNELGRSDLPTTDHGRRGAASERGAWRPVGVAAPQRSYQPQQQWHPGPQTHDPRAAGRPAGPYQTGPQNVGPQHVGPQHVGPQHVGPQHVGPQHVGPQHVGPRYAGPHQQPMPGPARPPLGTVLPAPVADAPPAPRRRGRVGRWIAVVVVLAALGGVGWYVTFGGPSPVTAAVGDCVAQTGNDQVAVVGCGEPKAQFKVAGKVEGKTMIAASLFACSDFPTATSSFWQGVEGKPGTVLCLAPLHP